MRYFCLLPLLLFTACERSIDLNLPEGTPLLVVEARLERILGSSSTLTQSIRLSKTSSYFSSSAPAPATGATVRVTDNLGVTTTFNEAVPGTYSAQLPVARNRTYVLTIDWQGDRYEATEGTRAMTPITRLYFKSPTPDRYSGEGGVRATIDFTDRPGEHNYYLWDQYVNGVRQLGPDSDTKLRIIATDEGYDGEIINGLQPFQGVDIPADGAVLVRQIALSAEMYHYYFALSDQVSNDGSPIAIPPASLRGNVANKTNPSRVALGYFSVSEVAEARATYKP